MKNHGIVLKNDENYEILSKNYDLLKQSAASDAIEV